MSKIIKKEKFKSTSFTTFMNRMFKKYPKLKEEYVSTVDKLIGKKK